MASRNHILISIWTFVLFLAVGFSSPAPASAADLPDQDTWRQADQNGRQAAEALGRCRRYVAGWLAHADPNSGLIPRNLNESKDYWNGRDAAADNYPFMVLTCALTDRPMFEGRMRDMLRSEQQRTCRLDNLVDPYSFTKQDFYHDEPDLDRMIFESSEYVKDGLMPLTEWLGPSPWEVRMHGIIDSILDHAPVETSGGRIPSDNVEVNGEMMQVLSRLRFMYDNPKYLEAACRIADYYLLGDHHPTRDFKKLRLRDHGCELISGLTEVYVACHFADKQRKETYREPLYEMLDRILEVGVNQHGRMFDQINPQSGKVLNSTIGDNWGYNYNGYYAAFMVDGVQRYRDAVRHVLATLDEHYRNHQQGSDSIADSVEGAINLVNREPDASAERWIDHEIQRMFAIQQPDGVIEGWHGDGNFARTAILYALWKQQGATLQPWREDVRLGAVRHGAQLLLSVTCDKPYHGKILFDRPRHKIYMRLPLDYPRINQFPEWFTVETSADYRVERDGQLTKLKGGELANGLPVELPKGGQLKLRIQAE